MGLMLPVVVNDPSVFSDQILNNLVLTRGKFLRKVITHTPKVNVTGTEMSMHFLV